MWKSTVTLKRMWKENLGSFRLLFSDDDDLWGPERIRLYGIIIDQHGRVPGVTAAT